MESILLLSNTNIKQYFIDDTYKCIPYNSKDIKVLILLIGCKEKKIYTSYIFLQHFHMNKQIYTLLFILI